MEILLIDVFNVFVVICVSIVLELVFKFEDLENNL